uniref:Uncharacterized protein n=1 Tax=Arundo donax TaxID=35708 RepID=A0A0A8Y2C9_ARUDO
MAATVEEEGWQVTPRQRQ